MYKFFEVLDLLETYYPYYPEKQKNYFQNYINWSFSIEIISTIILILIGYWHTYISKIANIQTFLLIILLIIGLSGFILMICCIAPISYMLFKFFMSKLKGKKTIILDNYLRNKIINDEQKSLELNTRFQPFELEYAHGWLSTIINYRSSRITFIFGNQIALISLVSLFFGILDKFGGTSTLLNAFHTGFKSDQLLSWLSILILSFVLGLVIGALILKYQIQRYIYWQELVTMALLQCELKLKKQKMENNVSTERKISFPDTKLTWKKRLNILLKGQF